MWCLIHDLNSMLVCRTISPLVKPIHWRKNMHKLYQWFNARLWCLVHPGVRDKRRVSEIDLSQPRHETAFWWRNNGPVTSQLTDPIKWPNYPLQLIGIFVHTSTYKKESLQQRCRRSTNTTVFDIFFTYIYVVWVLMDDIRYFAS